MKKTFLLSVTMLAIMLSACSTQLSSISVSATPEEYFSTRDYEIGYDSDLAIYVKLDGENTTISSNGATYINNILKITNEGTYYITGNLQNGQIQVETEKTSKVQIVLSGITITNETIAPIYIKQADKVFITLENQNTLNLTDELIQSDDENINAVIYSKDDLTLNGNGSLTINSKYSKGISSNDDLKITSGIFNITTTGSNLEAKDALCIANGTFVLNSEKDSIQSANTTDTSLGYIYIANGNFEITTQSDGISASSYLTIEDGTFNITTSSGSTKTFDITTASSNSQGGGFNKVPPTNTGNIDATSSASVSNNTKNSNITSNHGTKPTFDGSTPKEPPTGNNAPTVDKSTIPDNFNGATKPTTNDQITTTEDTISTKAIKADGDITINSGKFTINSLDDAIHTNQNVIITSGDFNIKTDDDAVHADANVNISGGNFEIVTCYEGIEGKTIDISGGTIEINAFDDGINSASSDRTDIYANISGGNLQIYAGGDGIDSNGNITVSGGIIYINTLANSADSALDYDGTANITGGTIIGVGSSQMSQNFGSTSTQGSILSTYSSAQSGDIVVRDRLNNIILSFTPKTSNYSSVLVSSKDIQKGQTYTVVTGSNTTNIEMTDIIYGTTGGMGGGRPTDGQRPTKKSATN